jgi:hypothetical protein
MARSPKCVLPLDHVTTCVARHFEGIPGAVMGAAVMGAVRFHRAEEGLRADGHQNSEDTAWGFGETVTSLAIHRGVHVPLEEG